jgi:hypothetical protein
MSGNTAGGQGSKSSVVAPEKEAAPAGAGRSTKVKDTLQIVSTTVSIVGAVGTLFVWTAANFYVGDVEVVADRPYRNLLVDVFDKKGENTTFHVNKFQLMPGKYHLEVSADGKSKHPADLEVQFGQKQQLNVSLAEAQAPAPAETAAKAQEESHHHWWQIWHRKNNQEAGG